MSILISGYKAAQKQRANETRQGATFETSETTTAEETNKLKDFPRAIWTLIKNPTYLFINLAVVCEAFLLAFISVFGPKIMESLFNISAGNAALVAGTFIQTVLYKYHTVRGEIWHNTLPRY